MAGDFYGDLPPPSRHNHPAQQLPKQRSVKFNEPDKKDPDPLPLPPLKSALKRPKPKSSESDPNDGGSTKKLKFKTITDTSVTQIVEAMQKIASHIKNPAKFKKASKLAIQLIQAGSVKPETVDHFFAILEAAMLSPVSCNDTRIRSDYHALFSAAQDATEYLNKEQKNQLSVWTIRAVVANDFHTDDSFVFSKAAGRIKDLISNLPVATEEEDAEEAAVLKEETETVNGIIESNQDVTPVEESTKDECDPFGLDALISSKSKKDDKTKAKKGKEEEEEIKRSMKLQREAVISCLEIAAKRYKIPWCQTGIDILVKHAFDNISRFTCQQRDAVGKLWGSIREQQMRRRQGKSVSGKLDVTAFELLQEKYSHETISIRRAVGGAGDRKSMQWLG